jgi:hypothetical protein
VRYPVGFRIPFVYIPASVMGGLPTLMGRLTFAMFLAHEMLLQLRSVLMVLTTCVQSASGFENQLAV